MVLQIAVALGKCFFSDENENLSLWLKQKKIKVICFSNPKVLRKQWDIML